MTSISPGSTPFLPSNLNIPEDEKSARVFLNETLSKTTDALNAKDIGLYYPTEVLNGQNWFFPDNPQKQRNGYRTIVFVPSLPNAAVLLMPHNIEGIDGAFSITRLYGVASNQTTFDYFEFVNAGNPKISFTMDSQNLTITSTVDLRGYLAYFVIDYLRN